MVDGPRRWYAIQVGWKLWTVGYRVASHTHLRGHYPSRKAARRAARELNRAGQRP